MLILRPCFLSRNGGLWWIHADSQTWPTCSARAVDHCVLTYTKKSYFITWRSAQVTRYHLMYTIPANFFWVKRVRFLSRRDRDFRKHSSHFQRLPTMFRTLPNVAENKRHYSDDLWTLTIQTDCRHLKSKEIIHNKSEIKGSFFRTTRPDLSVRREKLSLMREIDVSSPQAWDSRIMRESWQV